MNTAQRTEAVLAGLCDRIDQLQGELRRSHEETAELAASLRRIEASPAHRIIETYYRTRARIRARLRGEWPAWLYYGLTAAIGAGAVLTMPEMLIRSGIAATLATAAVALSLLVLIHNRGGRNRER